MAYVLDTAEKVEAFYAGMLHRSEIKEKEQEGRCKQCARYIHETSYAFGKCDGWDLCDVGEERPDLAELLPEPSGYAVNPFA